jgi:hypothetical protein
MIRHLLGSAPLALFLLGCVSGGGQHGAYIDPAELPDHWRTLAERTDYQETDRYDACVEFCRRLAAASPHAQYRTFGRSGEGRGLPLLILSDDQAFTPGAGHRDGKLVVLVESCIHPGECCGKDASLELARDILITGTRRELLRSVNLLILPIFNPDGHERFGPHNRINQNGPRETGWRVTATNLNLNRDFMKADTVELRAWLQLWHAWEPDLFFDIHTTDGSDHRYTLFYSATVGAFLAEPVARWMTETFFPSVIPALEADGHGPFPYSNPRNRQDLSQGIQAWPVHTPRFSTGYAALCNRPAILIEAHAYKTYAQRVRAAYAVVQRTLEELNRRPAALRDAVRLADVQSARRRGAYGDTGEVVVQLVSTEESEPILYRAVEFDVRHSEISGGEIIEYSERPLDVETRLYNQARVAQALAPPAAYLVPPQWTAIIDRLRWHGLECFRLARPQALEIDSYRFEEVSFPKGPYEGRFLPSFTAVPIRATRTFVAGTVVVPLDQKRAKLAVHLLEPDAPDALVRWGFLNAIFERKEYAAAHNLEPLARRMLARDPELRRAFEEKLATDEAFAGDPRARLNFFYRRSPYWDQEHNVYPIARLMDARVLRSLQAR